MHHTHAGRLMLGATALCLSGCGSQLADPGRSRPLPAAAMPSAEAPAPNAVAAPAQPAQGVSIAEQALPRVSPSEIGIEFAPPESARYHTVVPGDTLSGIARLYGVTIDSLLDGNGLDPSAILQPGQLIYIPGVPGEPGASAP